MPILLAHRLDRVAVEVVAQRSGLGDRVPVAEAADVVPDRPLADIDRYLGPAASEDLGTEADLECGSTPKWDLSLDQE